MAERGHDVNDLLLTPEEDAEFRRIGQTHIGDLTQKDLSRYHELVDKALTKISETPEQPNAKD